MDDREMLDRCLRAFEAIRKGSAASRKLVREMTIVTEPYAGSGNIILANDMVLQLCKYLNATPNPLDAPEGK